MSKSMYGVKPIQIESGPDWATELAPLAPRRLKVIWDISNKCNLRCRMCHFSFDDVFHRQAIYTSPALFERIAASTLPFAHTLVLSAANEPLISPHFVEILRIAARYAIPELLFLTNGQLLSPAVADAILETGVTQVQISIDGATKETYEYIRRGARFERLVQNLEYLSARKRALNRVRPRLQFNLVLMQQNLEELPLFVDLAERLGVEWIAARHLLMMRGLEMEARTLASDADPANHHFRRFFERVEQSKAVTVIGFPDFFNGEPFEGAVLRSPNSMGGPVPIEPQSEKPASRSRPSASPVNRTVGEKILREIRRIPRNIRRAALPASEARPSSQPFKLASLPFG